MSIQPVPTPQQHLKFTDSGSCRQWIEALPQTNVQQAQLEISTQLTALCAAQLPALERLKILEVLKETTLFVQGESAKRYAGKPLPLDASQAAVWSNVITLWLETGRNYQQCLRAYQDGDLEIAPHAALVCMRCIRYLAQTMLDHYRVYHQVPATMWRTLHELYLFAEQHGFARIRVADSFANQEADSSCTENYVQALLAQLANPFSMSVRQMSFVQRWLEKWSSLVGLASQPLPSSMIPSLAVDMDGPNGVMFADDIANRTNLRYLDLEQLSKTLRQNINLLKQGQTPRQLGLGDDAQQPGCENLLMLLYVQWCRAGTARQEGRQETDESAQVCFGIAAIHLNVSGRPFRQPGELTSREKQDLDTYGYIARVEGVKTNGQKAESGLESWQITNQSMSGFMCMLRDPSGEGRVNHNQLIAVRRADSTQFRLGMVQWLRIEENNELFCGVRLLPGEPRAVAVRPSNFNPARSNQYERALLLPEVATPPTAASLILPAGWFQSGRFVEVDRKQTAKLLNLLEKGNEFDRGTITIV
jgi:hypothetical protein